MPAIGFIIVFLLLATGVGVVALLVACFGKTRTAFQIFLFGVPGIFVALLGSVFLLMWLGDIYVRHPVAETEVIGIYVLSQSAKATLQKMGYRNLEGRLTLLADGRFEARDLPACCMHGQDERSNPFTGGYYNLSGTWKMEEFENCAAVELVPKEREFFDAHPNADPVLLKERQVHSSSTKASVIKGKPFGLGFSIFDGEFFDLIFAREKTDAH